MNFKEELNNFDFNKTTDFINFRNYHKELMEEERKKFFTLTVLALANLVDNVIKDYKNSNCKLQNKEILLSKEVTYNSGKRDTINFDVSLEEINKFKPKEHFTKSIYYDEFIELYENDYEGILDDNKSLQSSEKHKSDNSKYSQDYVKKVVNDGYSEEFKKLVSHVVKELKKVPSPFTNKEKEQFGRLIINPYDSNLKEKILSFFLSEELLVNLEKNLLEKDLPSKEDFIKSNKIKV